MQSRHILELMSQLSSLKKPMNDKLGVDMVDGLVNAALELSAFKKMLELMSQMSSLKAYECEYKV